MQKNKLKNNTKLIKAFGFWVLQIVWGTPQFVVGLIGFIISLPFSQRYIYKNVVFVVIKGNWGGVSFGSFVFVDTPYSEDKYYQDFINHERGHSIQSLMFGWLWFFVIGIPSFLWAGYFHEKLNRKRALGSPRISYYSFWTERHADKMGGVVRD